MAANPNIPRPAASEYAVHFQKYLDQVAGDDAYPMLLEQHEETPRVLGGISESQALHRYAPGKWSVKETIVHLADAERVFAYRALTFARDRSSQLPGFDEVAWVPVSGADARELPDLVEELGAVRAATLALVRGLPPETFAQIGTANGNPMSVRAALWSVAGHQRHHLNILRDRYGLVT